MDNVYAYMFHLLNEYAKLLNFKPTVPDEAMEGYLEGVEPDEGICYHVVFHFSELAKDPGIKSDCYGICQGIK